MTTRNTLLITALVGALTLLGASLFLAETPSQVSAQTQAKPAIGGSHPQAATASTPLARKASTAAAVHPGNRWLHSPELRSCLPRSRSWAALQPAAGGRRHLCRRTSGGA